MTDIKAFADDHGLDIEILRYSKGQWQCCFKHTDVRVGFMLKGSAGIADFPDSALVAYCEEIAGKVLVVSAESPSKRRIINAPADLGVL